jgi:hypothetical protein
MRILSVILLAWCLASCSRSDQDSAPVPVAPGAAPAAAPVQAAAPALVPAKQREHDVMVAIFGPALRDGSALVQTQIENDEVHLLMRLTSMQELPDGRLAVVVNGAQADERGEDLSHPASEGILNVYVLRRDGDRWVVTSRHQNVTAMGSMGNIGEVAWVSLGVGKPGFIVSSHAGNQGYFITYASVFELDGGVRELASLKERSENTGACGPGTECWDIGGTISFADAATPDGYGDMLVAFEGKHYRATGDAQGRTTEHVTQAIKQSMRYRFEGKAYVIVAGENPVPDI